jgi:23S rRNA (uracil1939-C5)-methyltransferase
LGIEGSLDAVKAAERASVALDLPNARFVAGDIAKHIEQCVRRGERFELVVIDPPRAGAKPILRSILELAPKHVAFVACDPVTLARDLRVLTEVHYEIDEVRGFDMFPQTHHVETLVWLSRSQNV